jgi:hypothetical protein
VRRFGVLVLFAGLAGGCPGGRPAPLGSEPDDCTPQTPTIASIAVENYGADHPVAVGDSWTPGTGGQGLTMSHFVILLGGTIPDCVDVTASAENAHVSGAMNVLATANGGNVDLLIGPVDASYDLDVEVAGQIAHVTIADNVVTAVR